MFLIQKLPNTFMQIKKISLKKIFLNILQYALINIS